MAKQEVEKTITLDRDSVQVLIEQMIKDNSYFLEENALLRSRIGEGKKFFRADWDNIINLENVQRIWANNIRDCLSFEYTEGMIRHVRFSNPVDLNAAMNAIAPPRYEAMNKGN